MVTLLHWGELSRAIEHMGEVLDDPKTLAPVAKRLRERAKTFVEGEGEGSWAPFAESTQKKRQNTGTSDITKHGKIRKSKVEKLEARIRAIKQRTKQGWSNADRKAVAQLQKRANSLKAAAQRPHDVANKATAKTDQIKDKLGELTANLKAENLRPNGSGAAKRRQQLQKQIDRATVRYNKAKEQQEKAERARSFAGRSKGVSVAETRKMMPRMPGTIRVKTTRKDGDARITTYSKAGDVGFFHHEGAGKTPKRTIIPDPTEDDLAFAVQCIEEAAVRLFEEG